LDDVPSSAGEAALTGVFLAAVIIGIPALTFAVWPLFSSRGPGPTILALPLDARQQLLERKRAVLRALHELEFEHQAGHISAADYADVRARYETEAASILTELDSLGPSATDAPSLEEPRAATVARRWRHPVGVVVGAVALVGFGVALGVGVVRYTAPDPTVGAGMVASPPLASAANPGGRAPAPMGGGAQAPGGRAVTPQMMQGMLQAARTSLFEGRYDEAISAYQAVLKRDPENVDALAHFGLIVGMGGHLDQAVQTIDRALARDPNYPPALLYRGQILYEAKKDTAGAVQAWEKLLTVLPPGEDRERVTRMIADAKSGKLPRP
jgi:cytochrome c-type biogenesis protein CcmH/NrfG